MANFKQTFAAARRAGRKTFGWNGKQYTTDVAAPTPRSRPTPASAPTPRARPNRNVRTFGPGSRSLAVQERAKRGPSQSPKSSRPADTTGRRRKSESRLRKG